jgi:hypothetical protein
MLCLRYEPGGEDWCKTKEIGESYEAISQCKQNSAALKTIQTSNRRKLSYETGSTKKNSQKPNNGLKRTGQGAECESRNTVFAFQLKWKLDADSRPLSPGRWAFIIIFSLISYQAITQLR